MPVDRPEPGATEREQMEAAIKWGLADGAGPERLTQIVLAQARSGVPTGGLRVEEVKARELFAGDVVWECGHWQTIKAGGTKGGVTKVVFADGGDCDMPSDEICLRRARSASVGEPQSDGEDDSLDDARHITFNCQARTLCGKRVKGDPKGFYLPLGEAPRTDEGGAWCWSCLTLQDEVYAARPFVPVPEPQDGHTDTPEQIKAMQDAYAAMCRRYPHWTPQRGTFEEGFRAALRAEPSGEERA
jgi:hypothetical protein